MSGCPISRAFLAREMGLCLTRVGQRCPRHFPWKSSPSGLRLTFLSIGLQPCDADATDYGVTCASSSAFRTASNSFNTPRSLVDSNAFAPSDFEIGRAHV